MFNMVDWITAIDDNKLLKKTIKIGPIKARIDFISYDKESDLWGIRFMRLSDTDIPTKVKENQEAEAIELDDDEYIGLDVNMLYE